MTEDEKIAFEHAWRYFALHAEQRTTVFNFYVASSGLLMTGLAYTLLDGSKLWALGAVGGIVLTALSFIFYKLDGRTSDLIKSSEKILCAIEKRSLGIEHRPFVSEKHLHVAKSYLGIFLPWTYGRAFRALFFSIGLLGLVGGGLSVYQHISAKPSQKSPPPRARKSATLHVKRATKTLPGQPTANATGAPLKQSR